MWFLPGWYENDWWDVDSYNKRSNHRHPTSCDTAMMRYAVDGHFTLSKAFSGSIKSLVIGNLTVGRYKQQYTKKIREEVKELVAKKKIFKIDQNQCKSGETLKGYKTLMFCAFNTGDSWKKSLWEVVFSLQIFCFLGCNLQFLCNFCV